MLPVQTRVSSSYFFKKQKLFSWIFKLPFLLDKFLHFENVSALFQMITSLHASLHLNTKSSQAVQHYHKIFVFIYPYLYFFFLLLFRNIGYQNFPLMICVRIQEKMGVVHLTIRKCCCFLLDNSPFPVVTSLCLDLSQVSYLCLTATKTSFSFLFQYNAFV